MNFLNKALLFIALGLAANTEKTFGQALFSDQSSFTPMLASSPKHEVRAVWLTTIGGLDWPHSYAQSARSIEKQKQELRNTLDRLQRAGINTVLLQTRIRATTIYPSAYEPWDGCLSGVPGHSPGYDALAFAVEECHRRGMELQAWVVAIPVGKWDGAGCRRLRSRYPSLIKKIGADGYMNPERPETAQYIAKICAEIVGGYDVDGIHLDYIRYPEDWTIKVSRPQGRAYITQIVRAVANRVHAMKPWVKMSCSPVGKFDDLTRYWSHGWNAYTRVCQDAQGWLREGLMDELFPMMYFRDEQFYPFAINWAEESSGRIIVPGLGIYFMSPRERNWPLSDITREMQVLRRHGMGHAYFRSRFFTDNTKGIYDFARAFDAHPALVPPMTWATKSTPKAPSDLVLSHDKGRNVSTLAWTPADRDTTMTRYNIYSSCSWPVDINDGANLIATCVRRWSTVVPLDPSRYYAVTAVNRYGIESDALQQQGVAVPSAPYAKYLAPTLLACDGHWLTIPVRPNNIDADYITIENIYGRLVCTRPWRGTRTNVSTLPGGVYVVRSLGKKGVTHRLGHFVLKVKK